ncbi:hypothetical protein [Bacillus sp. CGMCC 1.16541]|uniref:hypothetical protein n=1 Tax=Bacillus sp. CGMCC 1.16541 TaxID=2185143 RepID=UPI0013A56EBF|nr:hypothetical protein [Bacillus sp. CGMCC 1.16541]
MMFYGYNPSYNGNQKLPVTQKSQPMKQVTPAPKMNAYPTYQPVQKSGCGCGSKMPKR